jgi:hypothetical protein
MAGQRDVVCVVYVVRTGSPADRARVVQQLKSRCDHEQ